MVKRIVLSIISGLLLFSAFPPFDLWPAAFIGAGLCFHLIAGEDLRNRLTSVLILGGAFFAPLLHWSSTYVGAVPWLVLASGESIIFALIALLPIKKGMNGAVIFGSAFTLIELLRMKAPFGGFGWGRVGFTQVDSLTNFYPIIGVVGISFIVSVTSALIVSHRIFILLLMPLILMDFFPITFKNHEQRFLNVIAVQGSVPKLGLEFNDRALAVLEKHIITTPKKQKVDLFIWPENASDVDPIKNSQAREKIKNLINTIKTPLLLGAVEQRVEGPINSSLLYGADGKLLSRYIKQDLAPFGEYIPLRSLTERVAPLAKNVRNFLPGQLWVKQYVNGIGFQSVICFEVLDDDHIQRGADGAQFLIAQTNNATFGESSQAAQQLQITRARAAELSRQFAVVSTTGFTAHLDRDGKVLNIAEQFQAVALEMKIELYPDRPTFIRGSGLWTGFLGGLIALGLIRPRRVGVKDSR